MVSPRKSDPLANSSSSSSSPTLQDSPYGYLENLSPLKPVSKSVEKYIQRYSQSRHVPAPSVVFASPRIGRHRQLDFVKREATDASVQGGTYVYLNEDHQSSSITADEYFADCVDIEGDTSGSDPSVHQFHDVKSVSEAEVADGQAVNISDSSVPQPLQTVDAYKDSAEILMLTRKIKADQDQRGIRRHLQFGGTMGYKDTNAYANSSLPDCLPNQENLVPHYVDPYDTSSSWQTGAFPQNATIWSPYCPYQSASTYGFGFPLSGGINTSLYLNLLGKKLAGNLQEQEEKLLSDIINSLPKDLSDNILNSSVTGEIYARVKDYMQKSQAATYYINPTQPLCDFSCVTPYEQQQVVAYEGTSFTPSSTDMVGELNHMSPKKNRKRGNTDDTECKLCNCKKSRCLKLYCECFAAGVYCEVRCGCENCLNRPEYEDTVLDARQQIETRNPLAFAPKVVKQAANSPADVVEEKNGTTPSSARHKRGCNCKKSKCLKKYCECFQAEVGCSNGCRCEGCNNTHGKKAESIFRKVENWENAAHEQMVTDFIKGGRAHHLTPTWEAQALADLTSVSHRHAEPNSNTASLTTNSQTQAHQQYSHMLQSPASLTPKVVYGSKVTPAFRPESHLYDTFKDYDTLPTFNNFSTPTKIAKAGSPNQKRVSPPQIRSQKSRSSSSKGLKSGRKFILPEVPSFPPLTPYSKVKDGGQQVDGD
ncbi:uncharacterized protein LOC126681303 isoform X2 [Mercurialis annua]|uniref:uncharacterized protein LOC126681303 isoform X2 n=1 Tax=Mercurialis annua TaxID=3986 RepID=UPI002160E194|nr:uncharacterized protein LOC126681303 isoform X2 [Mercurialis annua]